MIRKLKGIIDEIFPDSIIIDVAGVGYHAYCSANCLHNIPPKGEAVTMLIETHVREDHIHLYGFASAEEQEAFQTLVKVSGVGNKMAMAILSAMSPPQIATAIVAEDKAAFKPVPGVGPKLASRLVTELKGKVGFATIPANGVSTAGAISKIASLNNDINDAITALVGLGYGRADAYNIITKIAADNDNIGLNGLIKEGLKELGRR